MWDAGAAYRQPTLALSTNGNGCGLLPTPVAKDGASFYVGTLATAQRVWKKTGSSGRQLHWMQYGLVSHALKKGWANPRFSELLMGWPIGWTDLQPLERARFQQWQRSLGNCSPNPPILLIRVQENSTPKTSCLCKELKDFLKPLRSTRRNQMSTTTLYFQISGHCVTADCDCRAHDGQEIADDNAPPLHDGCTCYAGPFDPGIRAESVQARIEGLRLQKELNERIEHKIMGGDFQHPGFFWEEGSTSDGTDGYEGFYCPRCGVAERGHGPLCIVNYSGVIRLAWQVLTKMRELGYGFSINDNANRHAAHIDCRFWKLDDDQRRGIAIEDVPALAICRAADATIPTVT
jgi:hypothetical protein